MRRFMTPEESILKPPKLNLELDDWPIFELKNVLVYNLNSDEPDALVSLLEASEFHPLRVTGHLELKTKQKDDKHYHGRVRSGYIEIAEVRFFSYGELEDGQGFALWAAGKCGWFGITPDPTYQEIYDEMIEAVRLLYFIVDAFRDDTMSNGKSSRSETNAERLARLFESFAGGQGIEVDTAMKRIYKHRRFLLSSMLTGKEGVNWTKNKLFHHLCDTFPEDLTAIKRKMRPPKQSPAVIGSREASVASTSSKRKRAAGSDIIKAETPPAAVKSEPAQSSRSERYLNRHSSTEAEAAGERKPRRTRSASVQVLDISATEDELPRPRRNRKSLLRLKPVTAVKGTPRASRSIRADLSDFDSDASRPSDIDEDMEDGTEDVGEGDKSFKLVSNDPATSTDQTAELSLEHKQNLDPLQEDTWRCPQDGCMHKIYRASQSESQTLIAEHVELHSYDDDDRVKLVQRLGAPSLPIKHLMERVKLQAKADQFPSGSGSRRSFPDPISQRY